MRKISIIIPCYNVERYIDRCMLSIAAQTIGMDHLEIICIDEASTDATWRHLQKWEKAFSDNVLLIKQEVNGSQGMARNIGLLYASADWISFVEADDWLEPDYYEWLLKLAEAYGCDVTVCGWREDDAESLVYFDESTRISGKDQYHVADTEEKTKEWLVQRILGDTVFGKIVKKSLLLDGQIFFPEDLYHEDRYWVSLLHIYATRVYILGKKLYHHFCGQGSDLGPEDADRHMDWVTIQLMKWADLEKRDLLPKYREAVAYDLLRDTVDFIEMLILRYGELSFSFFQLVKELVRQYVPDPKADLCVGNFEGVRSLILEALYSPLDREGFQRSVKKVKVYYSIDHNDQTKIERPRQDRGLRIVLFYSDTESFNFFDDRLAEELQKRKHEVFICDLEDTANKTEHSYDRLNRFISKKVDMVICFDGLGTREEQFIKEWDRQQAVVIDILMDPPFRFHPTLERHPRDYHLFCCDLEHVDYVKKYFKKEVPAVAFMPHVGVLPAKDSVAIPFEKRKYDILFSGTYHTPQSQLEKVKGLFPKKPDIWVFYQYMYDNLMKDSSLTIEKAVLGTLDQFGYLVSDEMVKMLLNRSLYVDWAIRMYHRGRVVTALAEAGFDLYLLGKGWEDHPSAMYHNVHRIEGQVPYAKTLSYMADAKINLNVMPWFKAGTHDRIFNTLLQRSIPLTDPSIWITENFTDGEDIVLYDLDHLERLPDIVGPLLQNTSLAQDIIQKGYEKVSRSFTWSDCADWILETIER